MWESIEVQPICLGHFIILFNLQLAHSVVPACLKNVGDYALKHTLYSLSRNTVLKT